MSEALKALRESLATDKLLLLATMLDSCDVQILERSQDLGGEPCIRVQVEDFCLKVYKERGLFGAVYSLDGVRLTPKLKEKLLQKIRLCRAMREREAISKELARIRAERAYVQSRNNF